MATVNPADLLGMNAKLYYKEGGYQQDAAWTELTNVRDVTLNLERAEADVTTRANDGWRAIIGALKEGAVEFQMVWETSEAGFESINDAFFNESKIGLAIMDADGVDDGTGLIGDFAVLNFSREEPLEGPMLVSVSVKLTYSADPPIWQERGVLGTGTATF